jgi:hypothetical protein
VRVRALGRAGAVSASSDDQAGSPLAFTVLTLVPSRHRLVFAWLVCLLLCRCLHSHQDWNLNLPGSSGFLELLERQIASTSAIPSQADPTSRHISPRSSDEKPTNRDRSGSQESAMAAFNTHDYRGADEDGEGEDESDSDEGVDHKRKKNGGAGTPLEGKKGKTAKGKAEGKYRRSSYVALVDSRRSTPGGSGTSADAQSHVRYYLSSDGEEDGKKSRRKSTGEGKVSSYFHLLPSGSAGKRTTGSVWPGGAGTVPDRGAASD